MKTITIKYMDGEVETLTGVTSSIVDGGAGVLRVVVRKHDTGPRRYVAIPLAGIRRWERSA